MGLVGNKKMKIPKYVNCQNKKILVCDYYILKECANTCAYAKDIRKIGIGSMVEEDVKRIVEESFKKHEKQDRRGIV